MLYYLNRELDQLEHLNNRLSFQLAQEAGLTNKRYGSSSSSSSLPRPINRGRKSEFDSLDDGRTQSDDLDMASISSPGGSLNSPLHTHSAYHGGLPASSHHRRRKSIGAGSHHNISRSPLLTSPMVSQTYQTTPPSMAMTTSSSTTSATLPPKRVRKRKDEADQSCLSCSATETPEWRKGPTGPRTLCNACGLLFAKQCRKKEMDAQARGERPRGSRPLPPEVMSPEEKERSLIELKIAVNARSNVSPI